VNGTTIAPMKLVLLSLKMKIWLNTYAVHQVHMPGHLGLRIMSVLSRQMAHHVHLIHFVVLESVLKDNVKAGGFNEIKYVTATVTVATFPVVLIHRLAPLPMSAAHQAEHLIIQQLVTMSVLEKINVTC